MVCNVELKITNKNEMHIHLSSTTKLCWAFCNTLVLLILYYLRKSNNFELVGTSYVFALKRADKFTE